MNLLESTYNEYIHSIAKQYDLPESAETALREGFAVYCESASLNEGRIMNWLGNSAEKALDWYSDKFDDKPVRTILATMVALIAGATGIVVPWMNHEISCGHFWPKSISEEKVETYGIDTEEGRHTLISKAEALAERLQGTNKEGKDGAGIIKKMVAQVQKDASEKNFLDLVAMVECATRLLHSIETGTCENGDTYHAGDHVDIDDGSTRNSTVPTFGTGVGVGPNGKVGVGLGFGFGGANYYNVTNFGQ